MASFNLNVMQLYQDRLNQQDCHYCTLGNCNLDQCSAVQSSLPVSTVTEPTEHQHLCRLHRKPNGFVQTERSLIQNLLLLSTTSSVALGIVYTLISLDRYFFGPWTFLGLSAAFLISALSVYYAQACVIRFGPNRVLAVSAFAILLFVLVHFSTSFLLFQAGLIVFALCVGPFYAAQLDFISCFVSRLVHLTPTIKRCQEERYQRLLHLLLFCPSHIVGHVVYILLYTIYARASTPTTTTTTTAVDKQALVYRESPLPFNCSGQYCVDTSGDYQIGNPLCVQLFQQQYCDHALYYIFSYQRDAIFATAVKPFTATFTTLLVAIFLIVSLAVIVILLFLHRHQSLQVQDPLERSFLSCSVRNVLFRTFHDHHLRLLLPMAFFVGLEQGFFIADFNKLYVSCALGLDAIGLVMLTRGCVHLGATLLVHEFVRHIHRPLILLSGAICQLGVLTILSLWRPNDDLPLYYVITACWALSNAIWETLLLTNILRTFCPDEWNYALLTLYSFTNLGLGASFGVSEFVCLYIKLYALMALLLVAIIPMKVCEIRLVRLEKILGPGSASQV